tara:strand:- start:203 stop:742 length:540 start_codon:yes stop_codon:yes gene_type:complete
MKNVIALGTITIVSFTQGTVKPIPIIIEEECIIPKIKPTVSLKTQNKTSEVIPYITPSFEEFIEAVIYVESRGDINAYNETEEAVGCLQIRPIMLREVNRVLKRDRSELRFTLEDRWDREKSIDIFHIIAEQTKCCENISKLEFFETVARRWNGGRRGDRKKATEIYWERVKNKLTENK